MREILVQPIIWMHWYNTIRYFTWSRQDDIKIPFKNFVLNQYLQNIFKNPQHELLPNGLPCSCNFILVLPLEMK